MTVKELINELEKIENKEIVVVISKDGEGNGFNFLDADGLELNIAIEEDGDIEVVHPDDIEDIDEDADRFAALVLWP